jgi:aprataxin
MSSRGKASIPAKVSKDGKERESYGQTHPQANELATTFATGNPRDGLLTYVQSPAATAGVVYHSDDWVLLRDKYPKATVHLLLMPRDSQFYTRHPFRAFEDQSFLASARLEAAKAAKIAASELQRLLGKFSAQEEPRIAALESDTADLDAELPAGRRWDADIRVGVHAYPSMNHMHIHVISKDMQSESLKTRKHYNTFNTPFFVNLDEFPLPEKDERWTLKVKPYYHDWEYVCWRCKQGFGNRFTELKKHLQKEYQEWRSE